jgi:PAS domain S-box-containing protein
MVENDKIRKILVVDDEENICEMLSEFLKINGFEVETSTRGWEALNKVKNQGFDVMLLDIRMPDMDGIELLKTAKMVDPTLPVIMMTGNISVKSAIESMRYGAYDYITKPFDLDQALSAVKRGWEKKVLEAQNRLLLEELKKKVYELQILYEVSNAISYTLNYKEVLKSLMSSLKKAVKYDVSGFLFANEEKKGELYLDVVYPVDENFIQEVKNSLLSSFNSLTQNSISKDNLTLFQEDLPDPKKSGNLSIRPQQVASYIYVSVKVDENVVGVINLSSHLEKAFNEDNQRLLSAIANQMSVALRGLKGVLASEKSKMDKLVESMSDGVIMVDENEEIGVINPAAKRMLMYRREEDEGIVITKELLKRERNFDLDFLLKRLKEDQKEIITREIKLSHPHEVVLTCDATLVKGEKDKPIGNVVVLRDITEQKNVERMKSEFISNISHELRTPLTSIKNSLDILTSKIAGELNQEQEEFLSLTSRNVSRLNLLINDILDFSRLESGKMKIAKKSIDIPPLCESALKSIESQAIERKIKLEKIMNDHLPKTYADPGKIEQVLINLLGNAIKFTPEGGKVTLGIEMVEVFRPEVQKFGANPKKRYVKVCVSDTGIGIKAKYLDKIFERFQRVEEEDEIGSHKVTGSGLGLAISKEIVELHNGKIWAESEPGQGSRFCFTLPAQVERKKGE